MLSKKISKINLMDKENDAEKVNIRAEISVKTGFRVICLSSLTIFIRSLISLRNFSTSRLTSFYPLSTCGLNIL